MHDAQYMEIASFQIEKSLYAKPVFRCNHVNGLLDGSLAKNTVLLSGCPA